MECEKTTTPDQLCEHYSKRKEQEHFVKAAKLIRLSDHTTVVVHPSKKFIKKKIAPLDGKGRVYRRY